MRWLQVCVLVLLLPGCDATNGGADPGVLPDLPADLVLDGSGEVLGDLPADVAADVPAEVVSPGIPLYLVTGAFVGGTNALFFNAKNQIGRAHV